MREVSNTARQGIHAKACPISLDQYVETWDCMEQQKPIQVRVNDQTFFKWQS